MKFSNPAADVFVPEAGADAPAALARVTHLCIGAHQDDIEIMAQSGISDCLGQKSRFFGGVVVTNGAGSPRAGSFASCTDEQMQAIRRQEQRDAARMGGYSIQIQLAHPSADVKRAAHPGVAQDLVAIFSGCQAEVVYLHNPADKHDTHVAVLQRCIEAIRAVPASKRPKRVLGCEVWRDLDWLLDADKVALDSGRDPELALKLLAVFDSQISGGKRYDLAAMGRRAANATFHTSHATDSIKGITWAVDLTPVTRDGGPNLRDFTAALVERLSADVSQRLKNFG
jgi:LmbE family N-acetylglucosaminyl deacetylase